MKLTIELVPSTSWYSNVRSNVSTSMWNKLRKKSYSLANNCCEICGNTGKKQGFRHNVECHEIWDYNDIKYTQTLIGLISLCPMCHKTKHIGLSQMKDGYERVIYHMMKINNINRGVCEKYIEYCFDIWNKRSNFEYTLDITFLNYYL